MKLIQNFLVIALFFPFAVQSQQKDIVTTKLDSSSITQGYLPSSKPKNINTAGYEGVRIDARTYLMLLADDFKQQFSRPFHTDGKDWLKVGGFALATAAVAVSNRHISDYAHKIRNNNPEIAAASSYITQFGGAYEVYTLGGFFAFGLIFNTQKEKTTTMLATQAYIVAGAVSTVGKYLFSVQRPYHTDPISNKKGPIFRGPFYVFKKGANGERLSRSDYSSFPSGHTTAAFAAATVYAMEYKDKPLIPIISYSAATLIGLSRITENKHWPVDVVVGAMLGYLSGRQVVNNYHRYSKLKRSAKAALKPVTFNLQYLNRQVVPGLLYKF